MWKKICDIVKQWITALSTPYGVEIECEEKTLREFLVSASCTEEAIFHPLIPRISSICPIMGVVESIDVTPFDESLCLVSVHYVPVDSCSARLRKSSLKIDLKQRHRGTAWTGRSDRPATGGAD